MDLVDANHTNLPAKLAQILQEKPLWSDVQDFNLFLLYGFVNLALCLVRKL